MDRGAWWATVHRVIESQTLLSMHTHLFTPRMFSLSFFAVGTLESIDPFFLSFLPSLFFFFPVAPCGLPGSWFPHQGLNPHPRQWKTRVLITGPQGNSLNSPFYFSSWTCLHFIFFPDFKGQKEYFSLFVCSWSNNLNIVLGNLLHSMYCSRFWKYKYEWQKAMFLNLWGFH